MSWIPSHEPVRYDRARVAQLKPLRDAVNALRLPPLRARKLGGLFNALEMQIEDGGDSPVVNGLLLDALRAGIRHQVDERAAQRALRAIDSFARDEARRWEQIRAGTLPPIELTLEERLGDAMHEGYRFFQAKRLTDACDRWLMAWDMVRQLARPEMRSVSSFDQAYGTLSGVFNMTSDLPFELNNAGLSDPVYYEHQLRFTREYLAQFPDEEPNHVVNIMRARGEALWRLGRRAEAEAVYSALVERLPDEGWGYIGWADEYWLWRDALQPKEYATAAAILQRALARPSLHDRKDVLERMAKLSAEWSKPKEQAALGLPPTTIQAPPAQPLPAARLTPPARKPGRNDPCWCGSGRKYKQCHLNADVKI